MRSEKLTKNHILIVDCHAFGRDSLRRTLLSGGIDKVTVTTNASKAISLCKQQDYDVVIAEYDLGEGKNGQQLLEELRSQRWLKNTSAFILLTAETTRDVVLSTLEFKPDDYLTKPYLEPALIRRLRRAVRYKFLLKDIYQAIDDNGLLAAIQTCTEYIRDSQEFNESAMQLLAELYLSTRQYEQALGIFDHILLARDADWARLGLAKVYMQQGRDDEAEALFLELIDINYMYIEAYECLSTIYLKNNQLQKSEDILSRAILVSPLSLRRQQMYASICEKNNHFDLAAKALRQVLRISRHSEHENEENYLRLSSCLSDFCDFFDAYKDEKVTDEISKSLMTMRKYHRPSQDSETQALLIESRVMMAKGTAESGRDVLKKVADCYKNKPETFSVNTQLEYAKSLSAAGEAASAKKVLKKLVNQCEDKDMLMRADKVLDEPVSSHGKERIIKLNREGIGFFKEKKYQRSVMAFTEAHSFFPRNIELNLNLVQALVKLLNDQANDKNKEAWLTQAEVCLKSIEHIPADHKKYQNYKRLMSEVTAQSH